MGRRRSDVDPELAELVRRRLAALFARPDHPTSGPGSAQPGPAPASVEPTSVPDPASSTARPAVGASFGRAHVLVVVAVVVVAMLFGGWSLVRAQPVPLLAPVPDRGPTSAPSSAPGNTAPGSTPTASDTPTASPTSAAVVVHVVGAVRRPGLVTLSGGPRVQDAIDAAGGLSADGDPGELNLAQPLSDGQQVIVGTTDEPLGELRDGAVGTSPDGGLSVDGGEQDADRGATQVDLNRATSAELDEALPGVGPVTAEKIIAWRDKNGRFSRIEELQEVDGIGPKTYADIAPHVRV